LARTVLLADDSVTAQNMGRRILVDAGYEVITVNNGSSALKKITEEKPDLIVLDVYMPGYGGLEVCQRIREAPETARIPVLLTVGKLEPFKADEARRVRADAFIVKPFEASELLTALTSLEDKIVAQPTGPLRGPLNVPEEPVKDFGDKDRGWRSRLRIPARAKSREAEPVPDPGPAAEEFYEVKLRGAESAQPLTEVKGVVPPTLAPETEPRNGQGLAIEQQPPPSGHGEEKARDAVADRPQADRKLVEDEVAAVLATIPDNAKVSAPTPTGPRWIAESVALTKDESSLVLEQEMETAAAVSIAAVEAKRSILSHYGIPSPPAESSMPQSAESSMPPSAETSMPSPTESSTPQEPKPPAPPEQPVSAGDTIQAQESAPIAAASSEPAGVAAAPQPESAAVPAKEVQAYAAQASAGAVPDSQGATEAAASSQASLATNSPAAVVESSEISAAAVQHFLAGSVPPPELTAEMVAAAQSSVSNASHGEGGSPSAPEVGAAAQESGEAIARVVDKLLAELKPKLIEEIAKKMKKDDK
jgi:CheY-like chemotaxis protein